MKTLYININNEQIQSNEELEVLNYDLDSDFFFYLGEKIAKGCKVENENALITDFNTQDNEEDYKQIIAQWNELKNILFSEKCEGEFKFTLPNGYVYWLRYSEKYNHVHDKNFSHGESPVISIDLEELYEESVEYMQREILRTLKRNDLYLGVDEIVFNDDAVTRKSPIVRAIKEKYNSAGFISYMKTLYININNEQIQSNEELEVLNYDLDSDFFFYLGEKIAKNCKVENENALIIDFNTKDNEEDYKQIITQWNEIKTILFSEKCDGKIDFTLPNGYIHWLRYSEKYNHVYDENFSHGESPVISIDLEELYEESVEYMQREILRTLKRNDLYLGVDEIVFNDDAVTRKSPIVRTIKEKYNGIRFKAYEKWQGLHQRRKEELQSKEEDTIPPIEKSMPIINSAKSFIIFLWQNKYLFIDENNELILRFPTDTNWGSGTIYGDVDYFGIYLYLWKIFEYEYGIFVVQKQMPTSSVPPMIMELLENRIICVEDNKIELYLDLSTLENFKDDFESELTSSYCINLSRYLRYRFSFNYLDNNITKTFVSWDWNQKYFGYITKTKLLCNNIYKKITKVSSDNDDDIIVVTDGSKNYILNQSIGKVLSIGFENTPHRFNYGLIRVKLNEKWGYIDTSGNLVISMQYEEADNFYYGLARVKLNGKWGYIDTSGKLVISMQYEETDNFYNGTAKVKLNGKYYFINRKGELFEDFVPLDKR